jgi:hypothetical protein
MAVARFRGAGRHRICTLTCCLIKAPESRSKPTPQNTPSVVCGPRLSSGGELVPALGADVDTIYQVKPQNGTTSWS